jgi:hypothetical protein
MTVVVLAKFDAAIVGGGNASRVITANNSLPITGRLSLFQSSAGVVLRHRDDDTTGDATPRDVTHAPPDVLAADVFAGTVDLGPASARLYTGGVLRQTTSGWQGSARTPDTDSSALVIGGIGVPVEQALDGFIGELMIYSRALSAVEIGRLSDYLSRKWGIGGVAASSPPSTPTGLAQAACDTSTGTGTIGWNSVSGATNYVLEWGTSPGGPYTTAYSGTNTSVNLDVESNGGFAYYRVKASSAAGDSAWSSEVYAVCAIS